MSNYTVTTNFGAKDSLPSGNAAKVIKGSEFTTEFTNIQTAIATKADTAGDTFTGAVTFDAAVTLNADVTFDTNTLFVDVSANRVGIGNVAPATALDVTGTVTASGLTVDTDTLHVDATNDRVGIGTTSPLADLHVSNGTNSDSTPVEFMIGGTANSVRTGSIVKSTTSGAYDLTLQTSNHATANQPLIIKLSDATEAMRIDSSGNVGIGTTNPAESLHTTGNIRLGDTSPAELYTNTNELRLGVDKNNDNDASDITFYTNDDEKVRITKVGNVGIGTTSPSAKATIEDGDFARLDLNLSNATGTTIADVRGLVEGTEKWRIGKTASASDDFTINVGSTERMRIDSSGNVGIGTTSPDGILHAHKANAGADTAIMLENSGQSGTSTASLVFTGNGGTGQEKARIKSAVYGDGYMAFHTNDDTEKMRIDSSGNVGMGTTSPDNVGSATTLHINDDTNGGAIRLSEGGTNNAFVSYDDSNGMRIQSIDTIALKTANTERMRIDSSGNLLVGKTTATATDLGCQIENDGQIKTTTNQQSGLTLNRKTNDGAIAIFQKDGSGVGSISVTSSATAYNTSSDERLKENIADSADAGSKIDAIQIRQFDWKADGSHQDYGVIAQELVTVAPEAVHQPEDLEEMMGVDYSKLVPMLIKEVQSLRSRVAELENA